VPDIRKLKPLAIPKQNGFWGSTPKLLVVAKKAKDLKPPSGILIMNEYLVHDKTDAFETYLEAANVTGMTYIIIPSINGEVLKSADQFKMVAEKMNKAAELCKKSACNGLSQP